MNVHGMTVPKEMPKLNARVLPFLDAVIKRIENPESWCQVDWARYSDGRKCRATDPEAVKWCLVGAMEREFLGVSSGNDILDVFPNEVADLIHGLNYIFGEDCSVFNDTHPHSEVIENLKRARDIISSQISK